MKLVLTGLLLLASLLMALAAAKSRNTLAVLAGAGSSPAQVNSGMADDSRPTTPVIQHVVIIMQENRSTDNMFHDPKLITAGADIASSGLNSKGQTIPLTPAPLADYWDMAHAHSSFLVMWDHGKMDGANKIAQFCNPGFKCTKAPANFQFKYVQASDVAPYFQMAETYTFADRMFQTNEGPTLEAHQFMLSGTSAPTATSNLFAAEDPRGTAFSGKDTGCTAPPKQKVELIDPNGVENQSMFPCFEHPTLPDLLDNQAIGWRYYAPGPGSYGTAPNAIRHLRFGADWKKDVILDQKQVLRDIANGQLQAVSWVIPDGRTSDHPETNDGSGPSWVASIVNALGTSQYWSSTAIFITWDDWGGWYDHVVPPQVLVNCQQWGCGYVYGFRVPLIVVSPYAKAAYISHVTHDFGSILKFIETNFTLPSLGYADAQADDLSDCFSFDQAPLHFHPIPVKYDANYFLKDTRPPTDLDDD
jgi:phospholipase C